MKEELILNETVEFIEFSFSSVNKKPINSNARAIHRDKVHAIGYSNAKIYLDTVVRGVVIKRWDDYETGEHSFVKPDSALKKILMKNGYTTDVVFVSEHDLVSHNEDLLDAERVERFYVEKINELYNSVGEGFQEMDKTYRHHDLIFDHTKRKVYINGSDKSALSAKDYLADRLHDDRISYTVHIIRARKN